MGHVLLIVEHAAGAVDPASLSALAAARRLGAVRALVAGEGAAVAAESLSALAGVEKVLVCADGLYTDGRAEPWAALAVPLAREADAVAAAATTFGKNLLPRVAALLDVAMVSDVIAIEAPDTFLRPIYAGNAVARVRARDSVKVVSVRATAFEPAAEAGGAAPVTEIPAAADPGGSAIVGRALTQSARPELTRAERIIAGGRGVGTAEGFRLLEEVADKLGAAVGATRAAVDAGLVPNDYQIGQTGKVVAPMLYVAVGVSGAIQHVAGMKESKIIVAINSDDEAPIFEIADFGLVGDLFEVLPELSRQLDRVLAS